MRHNLDKIGVFVSLVSTKVPFKGTGKEYIGDDIPEVLHPLTSPYTPVQAAVKRAIERCCLQLKAKIARQRALADEKENPNPNPNLDPNQRALADEKENPNPNPNSNPNLDPNQRALADEKEKRKNLTKYIPDVSRALFGMLETISKEVEDDGDDAAPAAAAKRVREADHEDLVGQ
eukprot:scaffold50935_cov44-Phaeocystis_antarctica.AAC.2